MTILALIKICMDVWVYMSNLSPLWPMQKQREALAGVLPDARRVFVDELSAAERMARARVTLVERDKALRASTRGNRVMAVASLACLDWTLKGVISAIELAHEKKTAVRVMVPAFEIAPKALAATWKLVAEAFEQSKARERAERAGMTGGRVSGRKREMAALAALETIRERWLFGDPREHPQIALLAECGVSRNTAIKHLGQRRKR